MITLTCLDFYYWSNFTHNSSQTLENDDFASNRHMFHSLAHFGRSELYSPYSLTVISYLYVIWTPSCFPIDQPEDQGTPLFILYGHSLTDVFVLQLGYEPLPPVPTTNIFGKKVLAYPNVFQYRKYHCYLFRNHCKWLFSMIRGIYLYQ